MVETIYIRTEFQDAATGKLKKLTREWQTLGNQTQKFTKVTAKMKNGALVPVNKVVKKMTGNFRKFQMQMLSIMFGAQMVSKAMWGLLKPAMEAAGIFELLSSLMLILFLPTALALLDPLIKIMDWFVSLPEPMKKFIGSIVLMLGSFMSFLASKASLTLFFGGMLTEMDKVGGKINWLKGELDTFGKLAAIGVGIYFLSESLSDLKEGNYLDAAINAMLSVLSFSYSFGKIKGKTAILLGVGIYFAAETINAVVEGNYLDAMADAMISSGSFLMFKAPWAGGVIIAVGFTLKFINPLAEVGNKAMDWINGNIIQPIKDGFSLLGGGLPSTEYYKNAMQAGTNLDNKNIGKTGTLTGKATGGYVPHTGLYKLHAGENVAQANSSFSPNITVNASSNVDIDRMKQQLSTQWNEELTGMSRR